MKELEIKSDALNIPDAPATLAKAKESLFESEALWNNELKAGDVIELVKFGNGFKPRPEDVGRNDGIGDVYIVLEKCPFEEMTGGRCNDLGIPVTNSNSTTHLNPKDLHLFRRVDPKFLERHERNGATYLQRWTVKDDGQNPPRKLYTHRILCEPSYASLINWIPLWTPYYTGKDLTPPPLKHWAIAYGFPRRKDKDASPIIPVI